MSCVLFIYAIVSLKYHSVDFNTQFKYTQNKMLTKLSCVCKKSAKNSKNLPQILAVLSGKFHVINSYIYIYISNIINNDWLFF